jgi:hypothetical protein
MLTTGAAAAGARSAVADPVPAARPNVFTTSITVNTSGPHQGFIDSHAIGLSFESGALNSGKFDKAGNLPQLMRNLGTPVMRFGGNSVDQTYAGLPMYAGISASALAGLVRLAKATGWTVLYSENLGHYDEATVKADAKAVAKALGPRLAALACGNEPNLYSGNGNRPVNYSFSQYLTEEDRCLSVLRTAAPRTPLEGGDISATSNWLAPFAAQEKGTLGMFGGHYYPMSCGLNGMTPAQWDTALLSPATTGKEVSVFNTAAAAAKAAKAPLWMTETNNACTGGAPGASNTYASALWAIDYILTGAEHGVSAMSFHTWPDSAHCWGYTPVCQTGTSQYAAQPVYYGMLFTHLLGSGQLLPVTLATSLANQNVTAFALKPFTGTGLRVIVENLGSNATNVALRVGGNPAMATILHLTGPSAGLLGKSGVKIQGASIATNGTFKAGAADIARCSAGICPVLVRPRTAVLVTIS